MAERKYEAVVISADPPTRSVLIARIVYASERDNDLLDAIAAAALANERRVAERLAEDQKLFVYDIGEQTLANCAKNFNRWRVAVGDRLLFTYVNDWLTSIELIESV